ncbi:uncharacterized protein LOC110413573 [Herrania umbratica]|uniref:Uncharacterized protein LOC110413573 n=1 Tax=Herrania umbratica TaxID=108875 RepID=A0A6J1A0J6_9ROSI|nr:uncharacterized protein LOC110413573 [Herrania umbratica]
MASPAKTSSSSSLPCRTNPNMKKSEISDPMRRSFSGNPFAKPSIVTNPRTFNPSTPANSPSDFTRRHSTSRESVASLRDSDKENSKDQNPKPTRVRSPAPSKGSKNFMSPTISAASKINASPRKKILVERNESVRSSVSFSDVKSLIKEDNESTPEIGLKQKRVSFSDVKSVIMEDEATPEIGLNQKKVSFSDVKSTIMADNQSTPVISVNQKKVTFADVKSVVTDDDESTPRIGLKQKNVEVPHDSSSSNHEYEEPLKSNADFDYKVPKNDSDLLLETVTEENDSVNVDPSFKISPRVSISPSCPILAPLDADPSMPPYDPKTNYLSPRPQFLHYRPNPRIDLYREREGKQLEEHFASESYSDTDVTEETQSEASQRESEDISSEETMKGEEEEEELYVSEPNPIAPDIVEESVEAKTSKPRFSTRSKFLAFLLVLAFAYFSILVVNSPTFAPSGLEDLSLSIQLPPEVTEFAKANFDRFTQYLQHLSARFLSCVSNIISSSREVHRTVSFQYANLSHLLEDHINEGHLMFDCSVLDPVRERGSGTELFEDTYHREIEADEAVDEDDEKEIEEQDGQESQGPENLELVSGEEPDEAQQGIEAEMIELDHLEAEENKGVEFSAQIDAGHQSNVNLNHLPSIIPQAAEVSKSGNTEGVDLNDIAEIVFPKEELMSQNPKIEALTDDSQSSEVVDSAINGPEDRFIAKNVMAFSLLLLCLLAATAAFMYPKRGKPSVPNAAVPVQQQVLAKKSEDSPVSVSSNDTIHERLSSKNLQTEVDMSNESCPSEMSSCQRTSSSYSKMGLKESNEYQSQERKPRKNNRRESLASSDYSTGSPSYGSFTTYEKIPNKHGGGDEEIVTPVRRSSRIRNQVTSP